MDTRPLEVDPNYRFFSLPLQFTILFCAFLAGWSRLMRFYVLFIRQHCKKKSKNSLSSTRRHLNHPDDLMAYRGGFFSTVLVCRTLELLIFDFTRKAWYEDPASQHAHVLMGTWGLITSIYIILCNRHSFSCTLALKINLRYFKLGT